MRRTKGIVRLHPVGLLKKAEKEARREHLGFLADAFHSVEGEIETEARQGVLPSFKRPLIEAPGEYSSLPRRVKKQTNSLIWG